MRATLSLTVLLLVALPARNLVAKPGTAPDLKSRIED